MWLDFLFPPSTFAPFPAYLVAVGLAIKMFLADPKILLNRFRRARIPFYSPLFLSSLDAVVLTFIVRHLIT